jgi:general secretion pathway protein F
MPEFVACLHDPPHGVRRVRVQAPQADAVARKLGVSPLQVLSVEPAPAPRGRRGDGRSGLSLRLFSQELAVLLDAGVPLTEALATLHEKDSARPTAALLARIEAALREGQPLSQALAAEPATFDPLSVAIVAASERTGQLAQALGHHAAYLAWSEALRARLAAAGVYPAMLLAAGTGVVVFLLVYVLPRFAGVFDSLGGEIPAASRALVRLGVWMAAHPTLLTASALALVACAGLLAGWPRGRAAAARRIQAALLGAPGIGPRLRTVALARLYRALGLLLSAGVPVLAALRLAHGVLPGPLQPALDSATARVAAGRRLSDAMNEAALASPVALRMLRVGESSGDLAGMLARAAAFHDEEIARHADLVARTVNPALMLVMGVLIGGIVVLMYLPIFTLMEQVQ